MSRVLSLPFWAMRLALAVVAVFTLTTVSNAQETLQPYAPPILHTFLDSANVYPESVTVDQSSGTFFVGSVKEGTIYDPGCLMNMDILLLNGRRISKSRSYYWKKYIEDLLTTRCL